MCVALVRRKHRSRGLDRRGSDGVRETIAGDLLDLDGVGGRTVLGANALIRLAADFVTWTSPSSSGGIFDAPWGRGREIGAFLRV